MPLFELDDEQRKLALVLAWVLESPCWCGPFPPPFRASADPWPRPPYAGGFRPLIKAERRWHNSGRPVKTSWPRFVWKWSRKRPLALARRRLP